MKPENPWTTEQLFPETLAFLDALILEINRAEKSIDIEMYIFQYDYTGKKIIQSLQAAAGRGVQIRVLVDAVGSASFSNILAKELLRKGIEFRTYHSFTGGKILSFFRVVNRRNHRKSWIIDSKMAFISSANVMDSNWKEVGVSVAGGEISLLIEAFQQAWVQKKAFKPGINIKKLFSRIKENRVRHTLRLNNSLVLRFGNYRDFLRRTKRAQSRIWFGNAYFVPRYGLVRAMVSSARRGVDVRLLLSHRSDVFFMPWLATTYYYTLLKAGVKIYEYLPAFYHAKIRVVDDWMIVGSTNLNHRSLLHDLEVDVQLTHPESCRALLIDMNADFSKSNLVKLDDLRKISIFQKLAARFVLLFRNWL